MSQRNSEKRGLDAGKAVDKRPRIGSWLWIWVVTLQFVCGEQIAFGFDAHDLSRVALFALIALVDVVVLAECFRE